HTRCSRDWSSDVCSSDLRGSLPLKDSTSSAVSPALTPRFPAYFRCQNRAYEIKKLGGHAQYATTLRHSPTQAWLQLPSSRSRRQIGRASCREGVFVYVPA